MYFVFSPPAFHHLLISTLDLPSKLGLTELLLLLLLLARCSLGSDGRRPLFLANKLRISVSDTTPVNRPDNLAPGNAAAGTEAGSGLCGPVEMAVPDGTTTLGLGLIPVAGETGMTGGAMTGWLGARRGVAGALGEGDADSTTHMRWELVATSLATVCASVE